jgi:Family of unknown function (DUF6221)
MGWLRYDDGRPAVDEYVQTMQELAAFIEARLDEDEATAKLAEHDLAARAGPVGLPDTAVAAHFARHAPARVLREIAGKRQIVNLYRRCAAKGGTGDIPVPMDYMVDGLKFSLRRIGETWDDHPDFRAEWVPDRCP